MKHGKHRAEGGTTLEDERKEDRSEAKGAEVYQGKGSKTVSEADEDGYGGHKRGGAAKKLKRGGKVGHPMKVEGGMAGHRMDRAPKAKGGSAGVGADRMPMTAAHKLTAPSGASMQTKTDKRDD